MSKRRKPEKSRARVKRSHHDADTLDELGYDVADAEDNGPDDPKIIDGKHFLPQHRERIVLVGFRQAILNLKADFTLRDISKCFPAQRVTLAQLLDPMVEGEIYPDAGAVEVPLSLCEKTSGAW
ncbi:hypothetical protein ACNKHL_11895 [Shigella flexneri]